MADINPVQLDDLLDHIKSIDKSLHVIAYPRGCGVKGCTPCDEKAYRDSQLAVVETDEKKERVLKAITSAKTDVMTSSSSRISIYLVRDLLDEIERSVAEL